MLNTDINTLPIKTALISVSNTHGLKELVSDLNHRSIRLIATGGTAKHIQQMGYWVTEVSEYTDFPEIMNGRVKTLHPAIHGGILAKRNDKKHLAATHTHQIELIDLVVINLYPFAEIIKRDLSETEAIENIDIGGPSIIRSAAKNHHWVCTLTCPSQYADFLLQLKQNAGATTLNYRQQLATSAFTLTASYDSIIANYLNSKYRQDILPKHLLQVMEKNTELSYGENPHQKAALYQSKTCSASSLCITKPLQGKALSYNNLLDASVAIRTVSVFEQPAVAIIKHNSPCGIALGSNIVDAFNKALACDPLSAFGGVIAINRPLCTKMINAWGDLFLEVVISPKIERNLLSHLSHRKNLRLLELSIQNLPELMYRSIPGGMLVQQADTISQTCKNMTVVTNTKPDSQTWQDLIFAWESVRHVKSNAIVFARDQATVAIGGGQTSRFYSVQSAIANSRNHAGTENSVVASDAFFPFIDGVEEAIKAGAKAFIQPGGAMRDAAVIECANDYGVAMVFTGIRHFIH